MNTSRALEAYQDREYEADARRRIRHTDNDSVTGAVLVREDRERAADWDRESVLLVRREQRRFAAKRGQ